MKKIKIICIDKLLAISPCLVLTGCHRNQNPNDDRQGNSGHNVLVPTISENHTRFQKQEPPCSTLAQTLDSFLLPSFENADLPLEHRKLTINEILFCLNNVLKCLKGQDSYENTYKTLIFYSAFIHNFGDFNFPDDSKIPLGPGFGEFENKVSTIVNISTQSLCKEYSDKWKTELDAKASDYDKSQVTVTYGDIKKFFNDLTFGFLLDKAPNLAFATDFSTKIQRDLDKARHEQHVRQSTLDMHVVVQQVVKSFTDADVINAKDAHNFEGNVDDGFKGLKYNDFIGCRDKIISFLNEERAIKSLLGGGAKHFNPTTVKKSEDIRELLQRFTDNRELINVYLDYKKSIRDIQPFVKNATLDVVSLIYRGIDYNEYLLKENKLDPLGEILKKDDPLNFLEQKLDEVDDYKSQKLRGDLKKIFDEARDLIEKVQYADDRVGNTVTVTPAALMAAINVMNSRIAKDHELFNLAHMTCKCLDRYFLQSNFIKNFQNNVIDVLEKNNKTEKNDKYGGFLSGVFYFLKNWTFTGDNPSVADPTIDPEWKTNFAPIECNSDNNPCLFDGGTREDSGFDWDFNNVQDILYDKIKQCVLPQTWQEVQKCFEETRKVCLEQDNGLFNEIQGLSTNDDFKKEASLRALDLLRLCFSDETNEQEFSFFYRLPQENKEFFHDFENLDSSTIIGHINKIDEVVQDLRGAEHPQIHNAVGRLFNFILVDNPNEVICGCNTSLFKEALNAWEEKGSLLYNVKGLNENLNDYIVNFSTEYRNGTIKESADFNTKNIVKTWGVNDVFKSKYFDAEKSFEVEKYNDFFNKKWDIENNLYYLLRCLKFLGTSIPRKFLCTEANKLSDSYKVCRNLALTIQDNFTNKLIACAKSDNDWKMTGFLEDNKIHQNSFNKAEIFSKGKETKIEWDKNPNASDFKLPYYISPFYYDLNMIDQMSNNWELSYDDYNTQKIDDLIKCPTSIGFNNPINCFDKVIDWEKSDFNNFISAVSSEDFIPLAVGGPRKTITKKAELKWGERKDDLNQHEKLFSFEKDTNRLTQWGTYPPDPCLCINAEIATKIEGGVSIHLEDLLDFIGKGHVDDNNRFSFLKSNYPSKGSNSSCGYLSLTKKNFDAKVYYLETLDGNGCVLQNFNGLLNLVKGHIDTYESKFGSFTHNLLSKSFQEIWNSKDNMRRALARCYLIKGKNVTTTYGWGYFPNNLLKCFTSSDDVRELIEVLEKNVLYINGSTNKRVETFGNLIKSDQFAYEIYGKEPNDIGKQMDNYYNAIDFFNPDYKLNAGDIFEGKIETKDKDGKPTGWHHSTFDEKWKRKVEEFWGKTFEAWKKGLIIHNAKGVPDDKIVKDIFQVLTGKEPKKLDENMIKTLNWLNNSVGYITAFLGEYDGDSIKALTDCLGKVQAGITQIKNFSDNLDNNQVGVDKTYEVINNLINDLMNDLNPFCNQVIVKLDENTINGLFELDTEGKEAKYKEDIRARLIKNFQNFNKKFSTLGFTSTETEIKDSLSKMHQYATYKNLSKIDTRPVVGRWLMKKLFPTDTNHEYDDARVKKCIDNCKSTVYTNFQKQLEDIKSSLTQLDNLTKLTESYIGMLKYVSDNHANDSTTIGKLLKTDVWTGNLILKEILENEKKIKEDPTNFYSDFDKVKDKLEQILCIGDNPFEINWQFTVDVAYEVTGKSIIDTGFEQRVKTLFSQETLDDLLK